MKLKIVLIAAAFLMGAAAVPAEATTLVGKAATNVVSATPGGLEIVRHRNGRRHNGFRFQFSLGGFPDYYGYNRRYYNSRYYYPHRRYYRNYYYGNNYYEPYQYYYNDSYRSRHRHRR